ncbi:MAG: sugar ABC transporter ATP-binding protein [Actinomycetaceae bacterium]|nr:sugar ABC transporter ATP-binding protein [Actinomycetaceae bacterium]MDY6083344.1 sugar ABC transporter ATP-binding protein [Actinomycetaceae bacterium]
MVQADEMPDSDKGFRAVGLVKTFAGVPALAGVSFALRPGEVVGLVGHNGAGKSTLLKTLAGAHSYDGGTLLLDGSEVHFADPSDAFAHGVATVYQELSLLENLSVKRNIWLGHELTSFSGLNEEQMSAQAQDLLDDFDLTMDLDAKLSAYSVAERQLLEIAVAVSKDCQYLLLDEPTTSLEAEQIARLLDRIRDLARRKNVGVLLVDHKLDELYDVADRIVALVDGRVIFDEKAADIDHDDVIRAIVGAGAEGDVEDESSALDAVSAHDGRRDGAGRGAEPREKIRRSPASATENPGSAAGRENVALMAEHISGPHLADISVSSHIGEVVGLYGLIGAGRTEFLRTMIGVEPMYGGRLTLFGDEYVPKNPADASRHGFAYVTEERKIDGIVPRMSSPDNVSLPILRKYTRAGVLSQSRLRAMTHEYIDKLKVKGNVAGPIEELSGGNQQKILIARALAQNPRVLLLDEPTKGVDIGVKSEIHSLLRAMAREGMSLIVVSSEEEEILDVADVVYVFVAGRTTGSPIPVDQLSVAKLRSLAWQQHR